MNIYLILSFMTLFLGPALFSLAQKNCNLLHILDGFILCTVFALVVFHVLPESLIHGGAWALFFVVLGLFGPILLSRAFKLHSCQIQKPLLGLALLGLFAHALLDGMALSGAGICQHHAQKGPFLALAVIIHRLPEGTGIWRFLRPSFGTYGTLAIFALSSLATLTGFFGGNAVLEYAPTQLLVMFQSLMAGLLLHVLFHQHHVDPIEHEHGISRRRLRIGTSIGAALGLCLVIGLSFLQDEQHHDHAGHDHTHESHHAHEPKKPTLKVTVESGDTAHAHQH